VAVQLLSEIGYNAELYVKYFETPLIEQCAADAVADARLRLQTLSVTEYLAYVHYPCSLLLQGDKSSNVSCLSQICTVGGLIVPSLCLVGFL